MTGAIKLQLGGHELLLDTGGIVLLPAERMLVVADLHLEKGSALARRGRHLPPYDTAMTLARLAALVDRHDPRRIVSLGDAFHDHAGPLDLPASHRTALLDLMRGRDWLWLAGNHDPAPPPRLGGESLDLLRLGDLVLRHLPGEPLQGTRAEINAHLHPKARLAHAGRRLSHRCFAGDGQRLIMPAFGAYAGGLNVLDPAIAGLFAGAFTAYLLGTRRVHALPHYRLLPESPGPGTRRKGPS